MGLEIRAATAADLPAINDIYNHYVHNSTCTYQLQPSSLHERERWFALHDARHPAVVGCEDGIIRGWASLSRFHPREAYARTVESSVYVHHDHHRRGFGRSLMQDVIQRARELKHHTIIAGISADQAASIRLHEILGFTKAAYLREVGYKFDRWLDVVWMQLMLE